MMRMMTMLIAAIVAAVGVRAEFPFATPEMVGRMTAATAVVNMVTATELAAPIEVRVRWAESLEALPNSLNVSAMALADGPGQRVELLLTALTAGTRYYYRVEWRPRPMCGLLAPTWEALPTHGAFVTQRAIGESFAFCALADCHWGQSYRLTKDGTRWWTGQQGLAHAAASAGMAEAHDFFIDLGDGAFQAASLLSPAQALECWLNYREAMAILTRAMGGYVVLGNHEREAGWWQVDEDSFPQAWCTAARQTSVPNPRGDTYPQGGEGSGLQNYYAWEWGDALFIVLDPFRYTLVGGDDYPTSPTQWSLGATQMTWLAETLAKSDAPWKFVLSHHMVGGGLINWQGHAVVEWEGQCYGRGAADEATRPDTEQATIHALMAAVGAQFFVYGHDHVFCHSVADGVNYICCGRPTFSSRWFDKDGIRATYGDLLTGGADKPYVEFYCNVMGYARFRISSSDVELTFIRTGYSFVDDTVPPGDAVRDWGESWAGYEYPMLDYGDYGKVIVVCPPTDVDGVRTVDGARVPRYYVPPFGLSYYQQPDPVRPEIYQVPVIWLPPFPEPTAVVDAVPELIYTRTFTVRR